MMNLFVFGWNCSREIADQASDELVDVAGLYPQLDCATHWSWANGKGVFAGSIHTPQHALGSRRYVHRDARGVTFFDGTAIDTRSEVAAHDAGDLQKVWDGLAERLEGQFVAVRIAGSPARVEILNDFLGMRQVYYRCIGTGYIFSSSVELLARLRESCDIDALGVSSFLCWGWASGDRTLLRGIRALPPGQHWIWKDGDGGGLSRKSHYSPSRLAGLQERRITRASVSRLADQLASQVTELTRQCREVSCGLTGGRDSRLLAATLATRGVPVRYVTYASEESRETQVASRVASALGVSHEISPGRGGEIIEEWGQISRDLVCQTDGMVTLWQVAVMLNRAKRVDSLDVFLGGHGGEISRGFYLEPQYLVLPVRSTGIRRFMAARLIGSDVGLATAGARAEAQEFLAEFVDQKIGEGFSPESIPDAFYTYDRVGRWAATVGMRPSLPVSEIFVPFCTRPFVELAFSMRLRDRYAEALQLRGIRQLAPALAGTPFEKSDYIAVRIAKDLGRWIARQGPSRMVERRRQGSDGAVGWIRALLPQLREECLAQTDAPLWDFVDRNVFERTTAETRSANSLPGEAVLRVATLFYYWRERRSIGARAESRSGERQPTGAGGR